MRAKRGTLVVGILTALALVACGGAGVAKAPASGASSRTLHMMISAEPEQLTAMTRREWLKEVLDSNILEPLIGLDKDGKPVPRLATSWEGIDGNTWRVHLRKGVKFHNGESFSSADVVATAKWLIDDQKLSAIYGYVPLTDAVAVDDSTVDLRFDTPQPLFLIQQIYLEIYPASIAKDPSKRAQMAGAPIGTGPYKFVKWDIGRSITLQRFGDYWGTKPPIGSVEVTWRKEAGVRLAALVAG